MTTRFAKVNGVHIAYRVHGEGPPLVLVMGYRLSSAAWPRTFVEGLARRFSVITLDNRGTGQSDKPVEGYAIANMARGRRWTSRRTGDHSHPHARLFDGRHRGAGIRAAVPTPC